MTVYWLLLLFPATMALAYPQNLPRDCTRPVQHMVLLLFALSYASAGGLRDRVGGDWYNYADLYNYIRLGSFSEALFRTDPIFCVLNWLSAQIGGGIYLVNGICCWLLGYGAISAAKRLREPWMAIVIAVPYLLIVVGLGYVRQGAAIGLILSAIASLDRARPLGIIVPLALAAGFHSTAILAYPLFVIAIAQRNWLFSLVVAAGGLSLYLIFLAPRMEFFDAGYFGQQYDSKGAGVRVLMGVVPSLCLLMLYRRFVAEQQARTLWAATALANLVALVALGISSSSTVVDRIALYCSIIQLTVYGEFRDIFAVSPRNVVIARLVMIGLAVLVQLVWLVFAVHADSWVPYKSILQAFG
jgi:hypothetical protein